MMRKLTVTGLAALAVAGLAGTGAALASSSHGTRPAAAVVETDKSSHESSPRDRQTTERSAKEHSMRDLSLERRSSDHARRHVIRSMR